MRKIDRIFIHCFYNGGETEKNTFRFENTSLRFTIVEHIVLRIIKVRKQEGASNTFLP